MGWQPIETAPKDRKIMLYNGFAGEWISQWEMQGFPLYGWNGAGSRHWPVPTHWMELLQAPDAKPTEFSPRWFGDGLRDALEEGHKAGLREAFAKIPEGKVAEVEA